jgi:hypothetical protein
MVNIAKGAGEPGDTVGGAIFQTAGHVCAFVPATRGARVMPGLCPSERQRAQGKPGVRCTRGPTCIGRKHVGRHHRFTGPNRPSLRNGFNGLLRALPVTGLFCHRRLADWRRARPGWASDLPPQNLTPASGRQDHTTSPSATTSFVCAPVDHSRAQRTALQPRLRADAAASTASRPTSVTIASRPSCGRDGRILSGDLPDGLSGIFFELGLDRNLLICPSGKDLTEKRP